MTRSGLGCGVGFVVLAALVIWGAVNGYADAAKIDAEWVFSLSFAGGLVLGTVGGFS